MNDSGVASSSKKDLFPFQEFVSKYMTPDSPYRGLLLYYGLGAGKTRTAIAACDSFIKAGKKVAVFLPASLRGNFEIEYKNYVPPSIRDEPDGLRKYFTFHHYNAGPAFAKTKKSDPDRGSFDKEDLEGKVLIIDEMHNFVSLMANALRTKRYRGLAIYKKIMNTKDLRIIALSGTPVVNLPFEVAVLMNILSGYKNSDNTPWDGSETPIPLFPEKEEDFNTMYLDTKDSKNLAIKKETENDFCRRLIGHISYYGGVTGKDVYPSLDQIVVKVPMSNHQFNTYTEQRTYELAEIPEDMKKKKKEEEKKMDVQQMEKTSSFRASTREVCNFTFPDTIERPWRRLLAREIMLKSPEAGAPIRKVKISINQMDTEAIEDAINKVQTDYYKEKQKEIEAIYLEKLEKAVGELEETKDVYLSSEVGELDVTKYLKMKHIKPDLKSE
jgi:hypothetical protein